MAQVGWIGLLGFVVGCGGSVDGDHAGSGGSSGGTGAASGAGGSGAGGSGAVAGKSGASGSGGAAGAGAYGGSSGFGGGPPVCCSSSADCPEYLGDFPGSECISGVCKPIPETGLCWSDYDCSPPYGSCMGASVCPCGADCYAADQLGKCSVLPGCCATTADCPQQPGYAVECVAGNCEPVPPAGQCWTDADCAASACTGACVCPCGSVCACGGQMGWCEGPPPPQPLCCKTDNECGDFAYTPCVNGVCKQPIVGYCWKDQECAPGQQCVGVFVCPCGAACGQAETPGKCI